MCVCERETEREGEITFNFGFDGSRHEVAENHIYMLEVEYCF